MFKGFARQSALVGRKRNPKPPTTELSIYLSIYLSIFLYLSISIYIYIFIFPYIYLFLYLFIQLFIYLSEPLAADRRAGSPVASLGSLSPLGDVLLHAFLSFTITYQNIKLTVLWGN